MKWKFGSRDQEPESQEGFWGEDSDSRLEYYETDEYDYDDDYDDDYDEDDEDEEEYHRAPGEKTLGRTVIYMVVILLIAVAGAIGMWYAADDVLALTKPDNVVSVTIAQGDSLGDVADNLKAHGLIRYKSLFMVYGTFSHAEERMGSGTFELNQQFDYHALMEGLSAASETRKTVTLTFPEGYNCQQMFQMLSDNGVCGLEELRGIAANYSFNYDFLEDLPYGDSNRLEGYMFPDTYDFYVDDDPQRVINKFLRNFDDRVTDEMLLAIDDRNAAIRAAMEEEGSFTEEEIQERMLDVRKMLTLASLIEKEAGSDVERTLIASVIYNRLTTRIHELLQIDASVEYALGEHKERLSAEDLNIDSPYNTYRYEGLPPGPIANPGLASIMAALYPKDTDYFFYALDTHGSHRFFETYMEQQDFLYGNETAEAEPEPEEPYEQVPADEAGQEGQESEEPEETGEGQDGATEEPQEQEPGEE